MKILAIETSFDETAAAIVEDGTIVLTNVLASSHAVHEKYGGVVPEIAARKQIECIIPVLTECMQGFSKEDIDAIAVTIGPGLIGSLLIGVETAKTLAWVWNKPIIPINHVLAHMYANFVSSVNERQNSSRAKSRDSNKSSSPKTVNQDNYSSNTVRSSNHSSHPPLADSNNIIFPAISLVVSGAHTELYLMESPKKLTWLGGTLDDAAGECFDKCARLLGFGNRGGVAIQETAAKLTTHNQQLTTKLPRPMLHDKSLNFSFSGLKAAVSREWKKTQLDFTCHSGLSRIRILESSSSTPPRNDNLPLISAFAYEIQEAITDVLVTKTLRAAKQFNAGSILLSGGVAANLRIREKFTVHSSQFAVTIPQVSLCTDNAAFIASYAYFRGIPIDWRKIEAQPDLSVEENL